MKKAVVALCLLALVLGAMCQEEQPSEDTAASETEGAADSSPDVAGEASDNAPSTDEPPKEAPEAPAK
ncbi:hypothetical protein R5R35_008439 [Gryllus longicercus]|uniref:Accessory gland protein n=1 Tax=Gryllus longicercus TaxID=2509291 RepID=A0AAN9VP08_9ORTH